MVEKKKRQVDGRYSHRVYSRKLAERILFSAGLGDVSGLRLEKLAVEQGTEGGDVRKGRGSALMASSLCLDCSQ
jgi:hypothetical protein